MAEETVVEDLMFEDLDISSNDVSAAEDEEAWTVLRRNSQFGPVENRALLVAALANVLTQLANLGFRQQRITEFHCVSPPHIGLHAYLERVAKYFQCSDQCLVLGLVFIDRIVRLHSDFVVSPLNVHRLLATSIMAAAKFWDDIFYSNAHYAKVAGVRTAEMCALERQFLLRVGWRLTVTPEDYRLWRRHLLAAVPNPNPGDHSSSHLVPNVRTTPEAERAMPVRQAVIA